jgi:hypothetical protein
LSEEVFVGVRGRRPKPAGQALNRTALRHDWTEVVDVPFVSDVRLPRSCLEGKPWPAATRAWWKAISSMPHCVLWARSDWAFAIDTALLAAEFHDGNVRVATELRNRCRVLGTTGDARQSMRIRYVDPPTVGSGVGDAEVFDLTDYRELYGDL